MSLPFAERGLKPARTNDMNETETLPIDEAVPLGIGFEDLLCHVRMFKPQFAPLVEAGTKCQTVRPIPKRMPKAGDRISLRMWTGKPYRSKQRVLRESIITEVGYVDITEHGVAVNSVAENIDHFAQADGFSMWEELRDWFDRQHGLPFEGIVIKWHND